MKLSEAEYQELLNKRPNLKEKIYRQATANKRDVKEYMPVIGDESKMLEDAMQVVVIEWAKHPDNIFLMPELDLLYAIPNARKVNKMTGYIFKITGVVKGMPDLHLPIARKPFFGYWIEMKTVKAYRTKNHGCTVEQLERHEKLRGQGHKVDVLCSAVEAIKNVKQYLGY